MSRAMWSHPGGSRRFSARNWFCKKWQPLGCQIKPTAPGQARLAATYVHTGRSSRDSMGRSLTLVDVATAVYPTIYSTAVTTLFFPFLPFDYLRSDLLSLKRQVDRGRGRGPEADQVRLHHRPVGEVEDVESDDALGHRLP